MINSSLVKEGRKLLKVVGRWFCFPFLTSLCDVCWLKSWFLWLVACVVFCFFVLFACISSADHRYRYPHAFYVPHSLSHARSYDSVLSDHALHEQLADPSLSQQGPSQLHGYPPHPSVGVGGSDAAHRRSLSSVTPDFSQHFIPGLGRHVVFLLHVMGKKENTSALCAWNQLQSMKPNAKNKMNNLCKNRVVKSCACWTVFELKFDKKQIDRRCFTNWFLLLFVNLQTEK